MSRCNLRDAVSDLAPPPPSCFFNKVQWVEYLKSAAGAQQCRGEPKVILLVQGEPVFNLDFPYCEDCTQIKSFEMEKRGLCKPDFLKELKKQ